MRLNEPEITLKITKEMLQYFLVYLNNCNDTAFVDLHNYYHVDKVREAMLLFSLYTITEKTSNVLYKNLTEIKTKELKLRLNKAERITMSVMFKRVDIPICLLPVEASIIKKLTYQKLN